MTIPEILPLSSAIFVFALGFFVFCKNVRSRVNVLFALFCFGTTAWLFGTFMMFRSQTVGEAIFWDRFIYIGGILNPIFLYHFGRAFLDIKKRKWLLLLGYGLAVFFLIASRTDYFVADIHRYDWGVHTQARILHHPFLVYFMGYMMLFLFTVLQGMKEATGIKRVQIRYTFFALLCMSIIGTPAFLPAYGVDIYPFAYLSGAIFAGIVGYAITRYRLMGITLIIRKTTVYLAAFLVSIIVFGSVFSSFLKFARFEIPWPIMAFGFFLMCITLFIFPPLLDFFRNVANKYFFTSLYESEVALENLIKKVPTMINLPQLLDLICKTLKDCFHLNRIGILLYNVQTSNYQALVAEGFRPHNGLTLVRNNFLTQYLGKNKKPLAYQELQPMLDTTSNNHQNQIAAIKKLQLHMQKIEASVCCPLISKNELIGIVVLGPKVGKDPYLKEDLEFLENLSYQISIGLENAQLYSEVKGFSAKLKKEVEKATKDLKQAYEELKKLDVAKTEFISIASHQLRTPLTVIKGYISMVLEGSYGRIPKKAQGPMINVFKSNERLIRLVNNLLTVSKVETGRIEVEFEKASVENIISSLVDELVLQAKQKGIYLTYKPPKKALPRIVIDKQKVRQAVFNVVDNAIKYTEKGGVTVGLKILDGRLQIVVSDTGEGMTKQETLRLFDSFSRGTAGTKLWTEGAGLGLYVAKKFVDLHNGKIYAKSLGKGKGSTFFVELPIK